MLLTLLGGAGVGLVWGWLVGGLDGRLRRPLGNSLALTLTTFALMIAVRLLTDWGGVAVFLGAAVLAVSLHLGWRHKLRQRFRRPK